MKHRLTSNIVLIDIRELMAIYSSTSSILCKAIQRGTTADISLFDPVIVT